MCNKENISEEFNNEANGDAVKDMTMGDIMTLNEYQKLAARTINEKLNPLGQEMHALHGMASEVGEIHDIYQKYYQGHPVDDCKLKDELGDVMWFIAEFATCKGWNLQDICKRNIEKLEKRYKEGFTVEESVNREEYR